MSGTVYKVLCFLWALCGITRVQVVCSCCLAVFNISVLKEGFYLHIVFFQESLNSSDEMMGTEGKFHRFGNIIYCSKLQPKLEIQNVSRSSHAFSILSLLIKATFAVQLLCAGRCVRSSLFEE